MTKNGVAVQSAEDFPTLKLGDVTYTLKFTRGTFTFRLSNLGVTLADRSDPRTSVAATVKILHSIMQPQFPGSFEDLTDMLLDEDKMKEAATAINIALGKVYPPTQVEPVAAGEKPAVQ
jgi:hypothetical protein